MVIPQKHCNILIIFLVLAINKMKSSFVNFLIFIQKIIHLHFVISSFPSETLLSILTFFLIDPIYIIACIFIIGASLFFSRAYSINLQLFFFERT